MKGLESELAERLEALRDQALRRTLRRIDSAQSTRVLMDGEWLVNFSSNDYLGLANDPILKEAAHAALEKWGIGSGASRLICGTLGPHLELEETLAEFKGSEAALTFSSGYTAAMGTICALLEKDDVVVIDRLCHACLVDGARLSGAKLRVFAHNDLDELEAVLKWVDKRTQGSGIDHRRPHTLVVTESIFSMDGDHAPLLEMVKLKERFGAWLLVDEAHATGVFGPDRRGLAAQTGVANRIDVQMGTLSKALGSSGGYICGSRTLVDYLLNRARSFIFSTAPTPVSAAAGKAAVDFVRSQAGHERCEALWDRIRRFSKELRKLAPAQAASCSGANGPIFPIMVGDEKEAVEKAATLRARGIFVPAIRYPTVGRGQARLRLTLTAGHRDTELEQVAAALRESDPDRHTLA